MFGQRLQRVLAESAEQLDANVSSDNRDVKQSVPAPSANQIHISLERLRRFGSYQYGLVLSCG